MNYTRAVSQSEGIFVGGFKFFFADARNKKYDITAVTASAIGNVHQMRFSASLDSVNRYAIGNTKTIRRKAEMTSGEYTSRKPCKIP